MGGGFSYGPLAQNFDFKDMVKTRIARCSSEPTAPRRAPCQRAQSGRKIRFQTALGSTVVSLTLTLLVPRGSSFLLQLLVSLATGRTFTHRTSLTSSGL